METFVLENRDTIEKMSRNEYAGKIPSHEWRATFDRIARKHSPNQVINWQCNCDSVKRAASIILHYEL